MKYAEFLSGNPRTMKRFANLYRFYRLIQWSRELQGLDVATPSAIGRWIVVMLRWPQLIRWIQWEAETESENLPTPRAKAETLEQELTNTRSYDEWTSGLKERRLNHLVRLVDMPLYNFLRRTYQVDESLARATEVGMW